MANKDKLPWDLVDEILSLVPPTSLVRFKTVCKRWKALFEDKTFINNHKMTFQFVLATTSKIYSVSVNPKIVVRELTLDIPGLKSQKPKDLVDCNEFLLCGMGEGAMVWNPWLRHTRCIEPEVNQPYDLNFVGIGYDNNRRVKEIVYKILYCYLKEYFYTREWKIYDLVSDAWKDQKLEKSKYRTLPIHTSTQGCYVLLSSRGVSLNGTLYWVAYHCDKTHPFYVLMTFNFSNEKFLKFCELPCGKNHHWDALVLRIFKGDRFSLLKQCHVTKKIMIWVTKNKIDNLYGGDVKWMKFMEVSNPNIPNLISFKYQYQPSYFIDDKRLVMCSCDDIGRAWIYVVVGNKLISKIQLDSVAEPWPLHCTYFPSLVLVPGGQREEADLPSKKEEKKQIYHFRFLSFCLVVWLVYLFF